MRARYHLLDVFTDQPFGGNPLAVFPDGGGLSERAMRTIAAELNLSETVFVLPAEQGGTVRVRIFTPKMELPFAGHPTVGTAYLLASLRAGVSRVSDDTMQLVLEEGTGPVRVAVAMRSGQPTSAWLTSPRRPELGPPAPPRATLASLLALDERDLLDGQWRACTASAGVGFLCIPVRDRDALARAQVELSVWRREIAGTWAPHVYVMTPDAGRQGSSLRVRMFAPAMGIAEDPATGGAAAALPAMLVPMSSPRDGTLSWAIEQGFEMGRPSIIEVEADVSNGEVTAVRVGGSAVIVGEGLLEVPVE